VYRRRYNFELDREFNSPNLINVVKSNRLRYTGHMIRDGQDIPEKSLYKAVPEERRNQARPNPGGWMV
jgi:hypothetical protein